MIDIKPRRVNQIQGGDIVVVINTLSNASLNLHQKAKQKGFNYIHCACGVKTGSKFMALRKFDAGWILKDVTKEYLIVAHPKDLLKVE